MFANSLARSVAPFLAPDEALLGAVMAQAAGSNAALLARTFGSGVAADRRSEAAHGAASAAAAGAGLALDRRMVLAVTSRRLLVFRMGGAFTPKAKELLGERAIRDVSHISVVPSGASKAVTLHVAGTAIGVETARGQPAELLAQALQRAHATG